MNHILNKFFYLSVYIYGISAHGMPAYGTQNNAAAASATATSVTATTVPSNTANLQLISNELDVFANVQNNSQKLAIFLEAIALDNDFVNALAESIETAFREEKLGKFIELLLSNKNALEILLKNQNFAKKYYGDADFLQEKLLDPGFVKVRIWKTDFETYNVGHVSLQTSAAYFSLWPNNNDEGTNSASKTAQLIGFLNSDLKMLANSCCYKPALMLKDYVYDYISEHAQPPSSIFLLYLGDKVQKINELHSQYIARQEKKYINCWQIGNMNWYSLGEPENFGKCEDVKEKHERQKIEFFHCSSFVRHILYKVDDNLKNDVDTEQEIKNKIVVSNNNAKTAEEKLAERYGKKGQLENWKQFFTDQVMALGLRVRLLQTCFFPTDFMQVLAKRMSKDFSQLLTGLIANKLLNTINKNKLHEKMHKYTKEDKTQKENFAITQTKLKQENNKLLLDIKHEEIASLYNHFSKFDYFFRIIHHLQEFAYIYVPVLAVIAGVLYYKKSIM